MRRLLGRVSAILALILVLGFAAAAADSPRERLTASGLADRVLGTAEPDGDDDLWALANANRHLLRDALDKLVGAALDAERRADTQARARIIHSATALARFIGRVSQDDFSFRRLNSMAAWSADEWLKQVRADTLLKEALTANRQGRHSQAVPAAREALAVFATVHDVRGQTDALHVMGQAHRKLGRYQMAERLHTRALDVARNSRDRLAEGQALIDLGDVHERRKRHDAAVRAYEQALAVLVVPEDWQEAGRALRQLGDIHVSRGEFEEGFRTYGRALQQAEEAGDDRFIAEYNDYLGYVSRMLGSYDSAILNHEAALESAKRIPDAMERSRAEARANNHLGLCHAALADDALESGNRERARAELETAIGFQRRALAAADAVQDRWRQGYVLRALASALRDSSQLVAAGQRIDRLRQSREYAAKALAAARQSKVREWQGLALHQLGATQARLGATARARASFRQALQIWRETGDLKSQAYVYVLLAGEIHERAGRLVRALAEYDRAIAAYSAIRALDQVAYVNYLKGAVLERQGKLSGASQSYGASIEALESLRGRLTRSEHKLSFFARRQKPYKALVNVLIKLYRRTGLEEYGHLAFNVSERARGRTVLDMIQRARGEIRAGVDEQTLARQRRLHSQFHLLSQELLSERDAANAHTLRKRLDELSREIDGFDHELRRRFPRYAQLEQGKPITVGDVRKTVLEPEEILVEYFVGERETQVFVISERGLDIRTIPLGQRSLSDRITALRQPFELVKKTGNPATLDSFDLDKAHELYGFLVAPLAPFLEKARRLIVVPDGPLFYLPFELLVVSRAQQAQPEPVMFGRFESVRFLLEEAPPILYALSASLLDPEPVGQVPEIVKRKDFIGFGNPITRDKQGREDSIAMKDGEVALSPLPFAEREVRTVYSIYGEDSRIYLRNEATKSRFLSEAPAYRLVLLSTHGLIDTANPMHSALVFAGNANDYQTLRTFEVFNMSLRADVVALSACEVGLGKLESGEGILGLSRAFLYAGASSLLVTLWSVEDRASSELVVSFFRGLKVGVGEAAAALRSGKISVMRSRRRYGNREVSLAHPFFWAPYVLIGRPSTATRQR